MVQDLTKIAEKREYEAIIELHDIQTYIKIGGTYEKFVPNINASRWNGECWLNVNHPDIVTAEKETIQDGVVSLEIGSTIHRYYIDSNSLEYEIILQKKPSFPFRIELDVDFPEGLEFLYQRPLETIYKSNKKNIDRYHNISSFEEYLETAHQPENAAGSYAVYWKKRNNQYKTGKFCHIYCPYAIDKNDKKNKCVLLIENKKIYITPDEGFLDKAAYPVKIDPTFGYEGIGVESDSATVGYMGAMSPDVCPATGTVTKVYLYSANTAAGQDIKVSHYIDDAGDPDALNAAARENQDLGTWSAGWKEINGNLSLGVSNSVIYWQAMNISSSGLTYYWDDASGEHKYQSVPYASAFPNPWTTLGSLDHRVSQYSEIPASGLSVNVSDAFSLGESLGPAQNLGNVSISDALTLSELITALLTIKPSVADTFTLNELIDFIVSIEPSLSDSLSLSESVATRLSGLGVNITDTMSLAEAVQSLMSNLAIDISDSISFSDAVNVSISTISNLDVDISDAVSLVESIVTKLSDLEINASDTMTLS